MMDCVDLKTINNSQAFIDHKMKKKKDGMEWTVIRGVEQDI